MLMQKANVVKEVATNFEREKLLKMGFKELIFNKPSTPEKKPIKK